MSAGPYLGLKNPLEKCVGHSLKNLGPLRKLFAPWCPKLVTGLYVSVITGNRNASEDLNCITPMFLTSFNIYFVFGYARFIHVIYVMTAIRIFLVRTGWQPW